MILKLFFTLLIAIAVIPLQAQTSQRINNINIDEKYMKGCETGNTYCKPLMIARQSIQDSVKLIFPIGGSQSNVYLYAIDSTFLNMAKNGSKCEPISICQDEKFFGQGKPMLNLTGLQDGNYLAWMTSCNLGGTFQLTISTINKTLQPQ